VEDALKILAIFEFFLRLHNPAQRAVHSFRQQHWRTWRMQRKKPNKVGFLPLRVGLAKQDRDVLSLLLLPSKTILFIREKFKIEYN